ncbi:MAG: hypothetical protein K940chlam7_01807, partial [Chlamydiae bacterium]|nr:hypothetical protein [Chlamydiota bacterium]
MGTKQSMQAVFRVRARAEITSAFLLTHHLHLLCCKFLKTNKLSANLRLASEAL